MIYIGFGMCLCRSSCMSVSVMCACMTVHRTSVSQLKWNMFAQMKSATMILQKYARLLRRHYLNKALESKIENSSLSMSTKKDGF